MVKFINFKQGETDKLESAILDMKQLLETGDLEIWWARPIAFEQLKIIEGFGWEVVSKRIQAGENFLEIVSSRR